MSHEQVLTEEGSHYEVSLTAGQAFVAFVLLLLSLAASFAFGLLIGKGQGDDRMIARRDAAVVNEAVTTAGSPPPADLAPPAVHGGPTHTASGVARAPQIQESSDPSPLEIAAHRTTPASNDGTGHPPKQMGEPARVAAPDDFQAGTHQSPIDHPAATLPAAAKPAAVADQPARVATAIPPVPYYAQLMSTSDQKAAEGLAAKLIDNGFTGAYVERGTGPKGETFRVRIKFSSEGSARAAIDGLKPFSKEIWVTKQP
jgi:hypothetical protein